MADFSFLAGVFLTGLGSSAFAGVFFAGVFLTDLLGVGCSCRTGAGGAFAEAFESALGLAAGRFFVAAYLGSALTGFLVAFSFASALAFISL